MPHTALYRKKRPKIFADLVGQAHIVRAVGHQLRSGLLNHAYLFCGTRGTGKTSAAKILARAVNCLHLKDGEPCNLCSSCADIMAERSLDVAEIDAASNNGVDNIRDLREEVRFMPSQGKYKVYIIDEVHMLSGSAFNALLKTLEEPPEHVIFILATTDPQKIPATILSRCQRYDFRRIGLTDMVTLLEKYLREDGCEYEREALEYIAYTADGAMRDALSLMDQCMGIGGVLTESLVRDMLGAVDKARIFDFVNALADSDAAKLIEIITAAMNEGRDVGQFTSDLIRHLRDVLVVGLIGGDDFSAELTSKLRTQSEKFTQTRLMHMIYSFSEAMREMKTASHARIVFEVAALRLISNEETTSPATSAQVANKPAASRPVPSPETIPTIDINIISKKWKEFLGSLPRSTAVLCKNTKAEVLSGVVNISTVDGLNLSMIKDKAEDLKTGLQKYFNLPTVPSLVFKEESNPDEDDWSIFTVVQ